MAKKDLYDVLGVTKTASADEIKSAYRKLARKLHPDATKNDPKSTEKFKEVQEAYDVLSDATKRGNYDQFGHAGIGGMPGGGGTPGGDPYEAFRRSAGARRGGATTESWNGGPGVSVEDFNVDGGDFGSIFEQLFGGGGSRARGGGFGGAAGGGRSRGRQRVAPERGEDIDQAVTLTFAQAARGTTLALQIDRDGKRDQIEVKIPAGVKDGSRIRLKGQGQQTGGEPGDLFIITQVAPHPYYRREGLDIYLDLPVSMYEAILGSKVEVPTLDGSVTMTIPPGSSGGAKLRIKARGIFRGADKGDQFVVLKLLVPKNFDDAAKETIKELSEKFPLDARADVHW
jgi:curved DNA-binding protein